MQASSIFKSLLTLTQCTCNTTPWLKLIWRITAFFYSSLTWELPLHSPKVHFYYLTLVKMKWGVLLTPFGRFLKVWENNDLPKGQGHLSNEIRTLFSIPVLVWGGVCVCVSNTIQEAAVGKLGKPKQYLNKKSNLNRNTSILLHLAQCQINYTSSLI